MELNRVLRSLSFIEGREKEISYFARYLKYFDLVNLNNDFL